MDNLVVYILVTLLSGAIGAGIGTYLGSHFSAQKQERRNKEIRNYENCIFWFITRCSRA